MKMTGSVAAVVAAAVASSLPAGIMGRSAVAAGSPVEGVVILLKDLKARLDDDGKAEEQVYDKYACWCEKTTARKAEAIESAKSELRSLGQDILSLKGKVASLSAEVEQTTQDISDNEKEQEEATSIRSKENSAYMAEAAEMKQAIASLERAITVLRGAAGSSAASASLLQRGSAAAAAGRALAALEDAINNAPGKVVQKLGQSGKDAPARLALVRNYVKSLSAGQARYAPQSATIQGILTDMYQTFAEDQQSSDSTEADQNTNFEALMATKQTELIQLQDKLRKAEKDKAESEQMLAEATQAYDDTDEQLKADIEFFDITKGGCTAKADAWQTRKTLRAQELEGITTALDILTSDSARELFGKAIKPGMSPSLLQVDSWDTAAPTAKKAYQALKTEASKSHSLRLARLATQVRTAKVGHFDKVLVSIDTLIDELKAENTADIEKRDQCLDEYHKIDSTVADLKWKIEVNDAHIDKSTALIAKLDTQLVTTISQKDTVTGQIADMESERRAENRAFLQAKKEDDDAIALLDQAKAAISKFYKDNSIELGKLQNFLQQGPEFERSQDDAPAATFSNKGHRKGESKGVISILTMLADDLRAELREAQAVEMAAHLSFQKALAAAEDLSAKLDDKRANLEGAIAGKKGDKSDEEADKATNEKAHDDEEAYRTDIKPDCDFMIKNFASRAEKRTSEMDGLRQAKEYLAGHQENAGAASLAQARRRPLLASAPSSRLAAQKK